MAIIDIQYRLDGGPWISIGVVDSFQIPGLQNGRKYSVQVRAVTEAGPGPSSTSVYRMPHAPGGGLNPPNPFSPNMWVVSPHNGRATVTINSLPDSDATINNIHYRVDGGIWVIANNTSEFDITGLTNFFPHQIQIRAFSTNGASPPSDIKIVTPQDTAEPPTAFTVGRWALISDEQRALVQINSLPPSTAPVTNIQYKVDSGPWTSANTTTSFFITGLTNEVQYAVQIRAVNIAGTSAASDTKNVTPHDILYYPDPFSNAQWSLVPGDGQVTVTISSLPASENPITTINYSLDGGGFVNANTTGNFNITGLNNGQTYSIRIRAVNGDGPGDPSASKTIVPVSATAVPSAFANNQWSVTVGTLSTTLNIISLPANNGSAINLLQYRLDDGSWENMTGLNFHTISNLTDNQSYNVAIRAINALGPSNASDTKTFTAPIRTPGQFQTGNWAVSGINTGITVTINALPSSPTTITSVEYRLDGTGDWIPSGGTSSFTINGLINGQSYTVELRAVSGLYGPGTGSATKSATPVGIRTYYVSPSGNNNNNGVTANTAWANTTKVNSSTYLPGDTILFQGGQSFTGQLTLSPSNVTSNTTHPLTISSYGTGKATINNSNGNTSVHLLNIGNVVLDNLNVTGAITNYGVRAVANNNTTLGAITIKNSSIYSTSQTAIEAISTTANSRFSNVIISNNQVYSAGGLGIFVHGAFANNRVVNNVTVEYNNVYDNAMDGIVVSNATTPKVQHNLVANTGNSNTDNFGILVFQSSNGNISNNQVSKTKSSTLYSGGIAIHGATENMVMEYNFTSENAGPGLGVLSYDGGGTTNATVRYNISALDGSAVTSIGNPTGAGPVSMVFHNNTIYYNGNTVGAAALVSPANANSRFYNNIFAATNAAPYVLLTSGQSSTVSFRGNLYWGGGNNVRWGANTLSLASWANTYSQENGGNNMVNADPLIIGAGQTLPENYKVTSMSPALDGGQNLLTTFSVNPGTRDYYGSASYGLRDIGAMNTSSLDPDFKSWTDLPYAQRTNSTLAVPAGVKNGDIMLMIFLLRGVGGEPAWTVPSGWTQHLGASGFVAEGVGGATQYLRYAVFWRRASSESGSYTVSHANLFSRGAILAIPGGSLLSDSIDNIVMTRQTNGDGGTSQNINIGGSVIDAQKSVIILFDVTATNTARANVPAGYTQLADSRMGIWYRVRTSPGNEAALSYNSRNTTATQPWAAVRLAIKK